MKVAITGANGFIGKKLTDYCLLHFSAVKVLTRKSNFFLPGAEVILGDLTSELTNLDNFVRDADVIFHCAGEIRDPSKMKALHINGTKKLLQAAENEFLKNGKKIHFVHLSSVGVYGPPQNAHESRVVTENSSYNPKGDYEVTKYESDLLVLEATKKDFITFTILRPSNVYGPQMPNQSLRSLGKLIQKNLFFYIGKTGAVATYIHVNDVVQALVLCATNEKAKGKIYNLSNDCTMEEMIEGMARALNAKKPSFRMPEKLIRFGVGLINSLINFPITQSRVDALVIRTNYPIKKIQDELNFNPKYLVKETIGDIYKE